MKRLVLLIPLFFSISLAGLTILSPNGKYFADDAVFLEAFIVGEGHCEVNICIDGACEAKTINISGSYIISRRLDLGIGKHEIKIESCFGYDSTSFEITNKVPIIYKISSTKVMAGDEIKVEAWAFKRERVSGVKICAEGECFENRANFRFKGGKHIIKLIYNDGYNYGKANITITVYDTLNLRANYEKVVDPGDIEITFIVKDAFGNLRGCYIGKAYIPGIGKIVVHEEESGFHERRFCCDDGWNRGCVVVNFTVRAVLSSLEVKGEERGDNVVVMIEAYDQSGKPYHGNTTIFINGKPMTLETWKNYTFPKNDSQLVVQYGDEKKVFGTGSFLAIPSSVIAGAIILFVAFCLWGISKLIKRYNE